MSLASIASGTAGRPWPLRSHVVALSALLALVVLVFDHVLFSRRPEILSDLETDLAGYYVHLRHFAFGELRAGNFPLWNPHIFCGLPVLGGFQAALLYPPNWTYLFLPLPWAANTGIVLHVFLTGAFAYAWAIYRGVRPIAALLSGATLALCGAHFLHIYAGHLSNLCAMPWIPLVLLSLDAILDGKHRFGLLLGVLAGSMLILAGHPQYTFYTVVTCLAYGAMRLVGIEGRRRALLALVAVSAGTLAITALPLWAGLQEVAFSTRAALPFDFVSLFSFPPENIVTVLAPTFFGSPAAYWGRALAWEMSLFLGAAGAVLAVYGATAGERRARRGAAAAIGVLLVLALGANTPVLRVLYEIVPGFDRFRGLSKFAYPLSVFAALLVGVGLDRLLERKPSRRWSIGVAAAALGLVAAAWIVDSNPSAWSSGMKWVQAQALSRNEAFLAASAYDDRQFVAAAARHSAAEVARAAAILLAVAAAFAATRRWRLAALAVPVLALAELVSFARAHLPTFDLEKLEVPRPEEMGVAREQRILNVIFRNSGMTTGALDIGGYDPGVSARYSEFLSLTQGADPDGVQLFSDIRILRPVYSMLRLAAAVGLKDGRVSVRAAAAEPLPRLLILSDYEVRSGRDEMFARLGDPAFDPGRLVLLEEEPAPAPSAAGAAGNARIVEESTDHLVIEASLEEPALLLVTDGYHPNWRVEALPGSAQDEYSLLPANWVLRAVPLSAGVHRLRLEYRIPGLAGAALVSGVSASIWMGLTGWWLGVPVAGRWRSFANRD